MIFRHDGELYLTYDEYAEKYGLKPPAVRQRAHRGTIWVTKIGRKSYLLSTDIPSRRGRGRPKGSKNKKRYCHTDFRFS